MSSKINFGIPFQYGTQKALQNSTQENLYKWKVGRHYKYSTSTLVRPQTLSASAREIMATIMRERPLAFFYMFVEFLINDEKPCQRGVRNTDWRTPPLSQSGATWSPGGECFAPSRIPSFLQYVESPCPQAFPPAFTPVALLGPAVNRQPVYRRKKLAEQHCLVFVCVCVCVCPHFLACFPGPGVIL